jgi:hypothetical protein
VQLNILIRGQSNAALLYTDGFAPLLAAEVERLLGFDGTRDTVRVLGGTHVSAFPGTPLLPGPLAAPAAPPWLQPQGAGFADGPEQRTLDAYLAGLPPDVRSAPTAIVWLHNEYDSFNAGLTPSAWARAVGFAIGEDRAALGQPAATTPVDFATVPYDVGRSLLETLYLGGSAQGLKAGLQALIDDPAFNAAWGAAIGDADMNATDPFFGGEHFDTIDLAQLTGRLARSIASQFAAHARPGSPIATGAVTADGPSVAGAAFVPGQADQVLVQLALPAGDALQPLSAAAAQGAGWSIEHGGTPLHATAARLLPGNRLLLTFPAAVPTDGSAALFYGYGSGRIAAGQGAGQGAAVYDITWLPLGAPVGGVAVAPAGQAALALPTVQGDGARVTGSAANVQLVLGAGDYTVAGGGGAMAVAGGSGAATVFAGGGNTTVRGGQGRSVVWGGAGSLVAAGGLAGADTLAAGAGDARLFASTDDTLVGGGGNTLAFLGLGDELFLGGRGAATVFAAADATAAASVVGGAGSTVFYAGAGRSTFWGGSGAATVGGGAGALDVIAGPGLLDIMGDGGAKELALTAGKAGGTILLPGFRVGTDRIALQGYGAAEAALALAGAAALSGGGSALTLSDGTKLILPDLVPAQLNLSLFF